MDNVAAHLGFSRFAEEGGQVFVEWEAVREEDVYFYTLSVSSDREGPYEECARVEAVGAHHLYRVPIEPRGSCFYKLTDTERRSAVVTGHGILWWPRDFEERVAEWTDEPPPSLR
ncbi:MAG: hypothetical protein FJY73_00020 [Candidatus Eisenbacteria bacterium]|nr:hypothetical protein [Candidatus Eisenbacteria bacterium]